MADRNVVEITRDHKALVTETLAEFAPGIMPLFADVVTETWLEGDVEAQNKFVLQVAILTNAASKLRSALDQQIWEGWETGKVSPKVKSIRAQRTGDSPGRKPTVKDETDKLMGF